MATWCDCGCHHALIDAHYDGAHASAAAPRCQACATDSPHVDPVVDYLRGRGLTDEQILERLNANREL